MTRFDCEQAITSLRGNRLFVLWKRMNRSLVDTMSNDAAKATVVVGRNWNRVSR